jgi:hypothetical protein
MNDLCICATKATAYTEKSPEGAFVVTVERTRGGGLDAE